MNANFTNRLAATSSGRVILHCWCLLRQRSAARRNWHWQGILRECTPIVFPLVCAGSGNRRHPVSSL
jgi:hypothetical protein